MSSARELSRTLVNKSAGPVGAMTRHMGKITGTNAGPPLSVDLYLDGDESQEITGIRYLSSYTPTVDDIVEVVIDDTAIIVLGDLA